MSLIFWIVTVNAVTRIAAVALAAYLSFRVLARYSRLVTALACGLLLTVSSTHLIPEAFESGMDPHAGGLVLLVSLLSFVILERILEGRFAHFHGMPQRRQVPSLLGGGGRLSVNIHGGTAAAGRAAPVVVGAACHNFVDGVLVAASFMADFRAGLLIAGAIFLHEVPNLVGQAVLLEQLSGSRRRALETCLAASMAAVLGGFAGGVVIGLAEWLVPYSLLVSAASFLYVVLCVMIPSFSAGGSARPWRMIAAVLSGCLLSFLILSPLHEVIH